MKVGLIYDAEGWCWAYQAAGIAKYAPPEYEVSCWSQDVFKGVQKRGKLEEYAALLHFSWVEAPNIKVGPRWCTVVAHHGLEYDLPRKTGGAWGAIAANQSRNRHTAMEKLPLFDRVICVNPMLQDAVQALARECGKAVRSICIPAGVDTEIFKPPPVRYHHPTAKLRVGWCGQRQKDGSRNTKGFAEMVPAIQAATGSIAQFVVNDRDHTCALSQADMAEWYRGLDVFLCTSLNEGTPMPVLEAAACGLPIISTDVGIARELIGNDNKGGVLCPALTSDQSLATAIQYAVDGIKRFVGYGQRVMAGGHSHRQAKLMSWSILSGDWLRAMCHA